MRERKIAEKAMTSPKINLMNTGGEILTLQFGPYSNLVGAHYWNYLVYFFFLTFTF